MREIEVKILDVNVARVVGKLEMLGAEKISDEQIIALSYNSPYSPIQKGNTLRLRKYGKLVELCYKEKIEDAGVKNSEETEVIVSDFEKTNKILEKIGFFADHKIIKNRMSYKISRYAGKHNYEVKFEFDTITSPILCPTYLEIEAQRKDLVEKYVEKLGHTMKDTNDWSQTKVVEYYRNKESSKKS